MHTIRLAFLLVLLSVVVSPNYCKGETNLNIYNRQLHNMSRMIQKATFYYSIPEDNELHRLEIVDAKELSDLLLYLRAEEEKIGICGCDWYSFTLEGNNKQFEIIWPHAEEFVEVKMEDSMIRFKLYNESYHKLVNYLNGKIKPNYIERN